jgi:integrase
MSLVYKHSQRHGLISRSEESNPLRFVRCKTTSDYEAIILTPEQSFAVLENLLEPERTLTLLAAGTDLRISECLGLQWHDVDFADQRIHVRRTWVHGRLESPKTKASKAPVPMHSLLAASMKTWHRESPFSQPDHWVFPSFRLKGRKPRCANMLVEDYLRPAAVRAGVLSKDDSHRFGFHNLRHSLASSENGAESAPSRECEDNASALCSQRFR